MKYSVIRYVANKNGIDTDDKLQASGSVQYIRPDKQGAESVLLRLYEMSCNQRGMSITKRTRYTFRCENGLHKYLFKVVAGEKKGKIEDMLI